LATQPILERGGALPFFIVDFLYNPDNIYTCYSILSGREVVGIMRRTRLVLAVMICIGIAAVVIGCQSTGRTTGQFIDDVGISAAIQAKFLDDPDISLFSIKVTSYQGEVTLTGAVNSSKAKRKAEKLAYSVKGVRKVNNHIKVQ
jgi:hyperosmotically inducible protein